MKKIFDVLVVGGGHSGYEAASAAARVGARTLLISHSIDKIATLSCNPAIGGMGKSQLVREIDALGGLMAEASDCSGLQYRKLNRSKGAAVQSTRIQLDPERYSLYIQSKLKGYSKLTLISAEVCDLLFSHGKLSGVLLSDGSKCFSKTVVICSGTFLGGVIYIGREHKVSGGRMDEPASLALAGCLRDLGFQIGRLKTGTPPRLKSQSIDFSRLEEQQGDDPVPHLAFRNYQPNFLKNRLPCYITHTNARVHTLIQKHFSESPLMSGDITGKGPRYCPSIEDKVVRFSNKNAHQIFLEPMDSEFRITYPNGLSTSLPFQAQKELLQAIPGLERAEIVTPGYAIEYDYLNPIGIFRTLESKALPNLFLAGQINGTTGYEEAGAQGLLAGLNAAHKALERDAWVPSRGEAYLGVMIDDLTRLGASEPYRMFTSLAEYRLLLREDNADRRLAPIAYQMGLIDATRWQAFEKKIQLIESERLRLRKGNFRMVGQEVTAPPVRPIQFLKRPEVHYKDLQSRLVGFHPGLIPSSEEAETLEIDIKYENYIERQADAIRGQAAQEAIPIPADLAYRSIPGLSLEAIEKLELLRPETLGQAARLPGVSPAAASILSVYLKKLKRSVGAI